MTNSVGQDKTAQTTYPILPLLAERWSPRGFDTEQEVTVEQIGSLLEAARWSPSCVNSQPWRYVVGLRGSGTFDAIYNCLTGGNLAWANRAGALIVISAKVLDGDCNDQYWAEYDTGQASAMMIVQAESMGLTVHQMGGFDIDKTRAEFEIPGGLKPMAVMAVGHLDPLAELPEPFASRELAPRERIGIDEFVLNDWRSR